MEWYNYCYYNILNRYFNDLTYSVSDGLGIGLIAYCIMMLVSKRGKQVPIVIYGVAIFFILNYLLKVLI